MNEHRIVQYSEAAKNRKALQEKEDALHDVNTFWKSMQTEHEQLAIREAVSTAVHYLVDKVEFRLSLQEGSTSKNEVLDHFTKQEHELHRARGIIGELTQVVDASEEQCSELASQLQCVVALNSSQGEQTHRAYGYVCN
jgi:flagellin-specific chaperone FliS